ncbi:MAG: 2-hydroxy-6-oxononadienedioate/2-hydroxy-6-oxononatrienedioate hydrolase [Saprospiraceae bacterium]|nr:2-hydroxy-6-oxononadienedioate/2-hydroxy-6-oxononatrienedioate hydrolase [Saprospiraceae bacterium]
MYSISFLLTVWVIAVQAGCFTMRTSDGEWTTALKKRGQPLDPVFLDVPDRNGRMIHAVNVSAADSLPLLVLVHGSPGSADAFLGFLADTFLPKKVRLVALDRPGFGYTEGFGKPERSLEAQAAAVHAVVEQLAPNQKVWLLGHSLGGPVIARFAMDYPEQTAGLILVAASIDPALEEHPWWQAAVQPPPLKWLLPKSFWTSNAEIKPLEGELKKMSPKWSKVTCPVTVVHAVNDCLVPVANVDFARQVLTGVADLQIEILPDGDHFILWNRYEKVRKAIFDAIGGNKSN